MHFRDHTVQRKSQPLCNPGDAFVVRPNHRTLKTKMPCNRQTGVECATQFQTVTHNVRLNDLAVPHGASEHKLFLHIPVQLARLVIALRFDQFDRVQLGVVMPEIMRLDILPQEVLHLWITNA